MGSTHTHIQCEHFVFFKITAVCTLCTYFSSPPALSFWWVELGPQVRPFFLLLDRSSFLHTALRPQVLLPSVGVTEVQGQKPREPMQTIWRPYQMLHLHLMALNRGMTPGLAGGVVLSLPWVFLLSTLGEAWTVILCSKPGEKCVLHYS